MQMGKGAEHYIRTGRARQITREALEIVKRAEENGLMHDIPNIEGAGESAAIATAAPAPASVCARGADVRRARRDPLKLPPKWTRQKCRLCAVRRGPPRKRP